ncbi:MAG: SAM-dependent methyltransferase [Anaerolineaceae bacterium]|nr:SAM-dependent methyltransferase [Anaerolineaceae bacterium]
MAIVLKQVVPWGRSADEYCHMFALSEADLSRRILGAGDGPASFNAELTAKSFNVVSFDPIYDFTAQEIAQRVEETYEDMVRQMWEDRDGFVWKRFANPDDSGKARLKAMEIFLADFECGKQQGRYITGSLPTLPFDDGQFDLALCSHLLFLYSQHLSTDFHLQSVQELCRVGKEVRIFPLLDLTRNKSEHVEPVCAHMTELGYKVDIQIVDYEFQRGGNQMMKITKIEV